MAMEEKRKSRLYRLKPLTDRLPAVTRPEGHVHFRTKLFWLLLILVLYFVMTNVFLYGLDKSKTLDFFASLRAILAGAQGSLMHLGIGPIVTGSIIMQLFAGAKIINLNLKDDEDKSVYQGTQKLLVIIMILVESIPQVFGFLTPSGGFVSNLNGFSIPYILPAGSGESLAQFRSSSSCLRAATSSSLWTRLSRSGGSGPASPFSSRRALPSRSSPGRSTGS